MNGETPVSQLWLITGRKRQSLPSRRPWLCKSVSCSGQWCCHHPSRASLWIKTSSLSIEPISASVGWCWWHWSESSPVTGQWRRESSGSPFVFYHSCLFGSSFQSCHPTGHSLWKSTLSLYFFTVCLHPPEQLPGQLLGLLRPPKCRPAFYVRGSTAGLGQNQVP